MLEDDDLEHIYIEKKDLEHALRIPTDMLNQSDSLELELEKDTMDNGEVLGRNSRCVAVATIPFAPLGRKEKKRFRGKEALVKFRCTVYEKKLLMVKAKRCGLTLSEYIRRCVLEKDIAERFTEEQMDIYRMLVKYHNNFKWIGNMYRKRNPKLTEEVHRLADDIKAHLKKFNQ